MALWQAPEAIQPPFRRNVPLMQAVIAAHVPREEWTIQFRSTIFGVYVICGPVHRSRTTNELRIGLAFITAGGRKPSSEVQSIWIGRPELLDIGGAERDPLDVAHGAIVRADIASFGDSLTVVGHAVSQQVNGFTGVGRHTLCTPRGVSPSLRSLVEIVDESPDAPAPLHSWADAP